MTTVTQSPLRRRMTMATFLARPAHAGQVDELLDGVLVVSPSANESHGALCMELAAQLHRQCKARGLGRVYGSPLTAVLDAHNAPQPDLCVIVADRAHIVQDGYPRAAPDLVIEVLSPATRRIDCGAKKRLYERAGVREYWIVAQEAEGTIVFYDEDEDEFGLAQLTRRGTRETTGVRGELVDVFMAR